MDVAAVVDAIAAMSGQRVDVYGHSHGGIVAFGAATLTANIRRLVLYEGWPVPDPSIYALPADVLRRMDKMLAVGDRDGVVEALFRSVEEMSDEDMAVLRSAPSWPGRVAAAHTVPREVVGETQARLEAEQAAKINVPVLLLTGEKSTDPAKAAVGAVAGALPDVRLLVLAGQQHVADILDPETFATYLLDFLHGRTLSHAAGGLSGRAVRCDSELITVQSDACAPVTSRFALAARGDSRQRPDRPAVGSSLRPVVPPDRACRGAATAMTVRPVRPLCRAHRPVRRREILLRRSGGRWSMTSASQCR